MCPVNLKQVNHPAQKRSEEEGAQIEHRKAHHEEHREQVAVAEVLPPINTQSRFLAGARFGGFGHRDMRETQLLRKLSARIGCRSCRGKENHRAFKVFSRRFFSVTSEILEIASNEAEIFLCRGETGWSSVAVILPFVLFNSL